MSLNQVNSSGELERVAGLVNSEKINEMYDAFPSNASASDKLVVTSALNNRVREVFRIPYNMTIENFLARFTQRGIYKGEVFIEGSIEGIAVNHWCLYDATIVSATDSYVGGIKITDMTNGNEFIYQSYDTGSFNWVLVTKSGVPKYETLSVTLEASPSVSPYTHYATVSLTASTVNKVVSIVVSGTSLDRAYAVWSDGYDNKLIYVYGMQEATVKLVVGYI